MASSNSIGGGVRIQPVLGDLVDDRRGERRQRGPAELVGQALGQDAADLGQRPRPASLGPQSFAASRPMPIERGEQLRHAVSGRAVVTSTSGASGRGRSGRASAADGRDEHRPELGGRPLRARLVALVDDDEVGHLQQACLDRLDLVAHLGRLDHDRRVGDGRDLHLALAGPDGLDEHEVEAGRVEHRRRRGRVEASPPACPRDAIERMNTSSSPAYACIRTRSPRSAPPVIGLDGSTARTATGASGGPHLRDQRRDQRALARPRAVR